MFNISENTAGGHLTLNLLGRFDLEAREVFKAAMGTPLALETPHLILNLTHVSFIDSSAMGWLAFAHKQFQSAHRQLTLVVPPGDLWQFLEMANFDELVPMVTTEEAAMKMKA